MRTYVTGLGGGQLVKVLCRRQASCGAWELRIVDGEAVDVPLACFIGI
jgi:hypothetical protein